MRLRDLGISTGLLPPGGLNAITDVPGVAVGHVTLVRGDGPLEVGKGPVRTGVTIILPRGGNGRDIGREPVFAGAHVLNGNGELTGLEWVRESGMLTTPIGLTNTHSVGVVRDALVRASVEAHGGEQGPRWSLPVVGETWDGYLNDVDGQHVSQDHALEAIRLASAGPVAEGNVGGGTGMKAFGFKAGIGTASRRVQTDDAGPFVVGALVQANFGRRERLMIDGVPVGREIPADEPASDAADGGSVIGVVATDAPLLPHQCRRLAQRASLGVARTGGGGEHSSGDLFLAFATGNAGLRNEDDPDAPGTHALRMLNDDRIDLLFWATIEAVEEAIYNALIAAETMTGRDGITFHALPHARLLQVMDRYGRGPAARG